jgi:hypothetical protein
MLAFRIKAKALRDMKSSCGRFGFEIARRGCACAKLSDPIIQLSGAEPISLEIQPHQIRSFRPISEYDFNKNQLKFIQLMNHVLRRHIRFDLFRRR